MKKNYVKLKASLARTAGLMMLLMAMLAPLGAWAEELTVYQNETATNIFVPIYGYYVDTQHTDQHIIPASDLSSMSGSDISSMKYYIQSTGWGSGWGTANFKIYLSETTNSSYSSVNIYDYSGATLVYNGSLNVSNNQLLISFQSNYSYSGQNLMVTFVCEAGGGYMDYTFYGKTMSSATAVTYGCYNARTNNFLPRTTFTYESSGPKYDITAGTIDHADGMAFSPNPAGEGKTVTVTAVNPEFGWSIQSVSVTGATSGTHNYPGNTFTMPGEDVTVSATMTPGDVDIIVCDDASLLPSGGSIGNTTVLPVYAGYNYSTTAMIYPASYFNPMPPQGTTINKISFKKNAANTSGTFSNVKIYLRCTTQTQITSTSAAWNMTSSECYYTGSYTSVYGNEWVEIELDKPFVYDGSSNIMVCTYNYSNNSYASIQHKNFGWSKSGMGVEYHNSSDVLNPETFTSTSGGGNCNWIIIARFTCTPAASGYAITKVENNCTISTTVGDNEVTRAEEGETVTLACTPHTHYTFNSWNVYKTGEPATTVTVTNNTFEMPAYAVTVAANLTEDDKYTITCTPTPAAGGEISLWPSGTEFYPGTEIYVDCYPNSHWTYNNDMKVVKTTDPSVVVATESPFIMPSFGVTITASFSEGAKHTITLHKNGQIIKDYAYVGGSYTIPSADDADGYKFQGWNLSYVDNTTEEVIPYYTSGTVIYPDSDMDLWTVFKSGSSAPDFVLMETAAFVNGAKLMISFYDNATGKNGFMSIKNGSFVIDEDGVEVIDGRISGEYASEYGFTSLFVETVPGWGLEKYTLNIDGQYVRKNGSAITVTNDASLDECKWILYAGTFYDYDAYYMMWLNNGVLNVNDNYYSSFNFYKQESTSKDGETEYCSFTDRGDLAESLSEVHKGYIVSEPVNINSLTILSGELVNTNPENIIIKDGGQLELIQYNTNVKATVEKNIAANSKGDPYTVTKWYTIGSPVNAPYINGSTGNYVANIIPAGGMSDESYNLYYLDETTWVNYRQELNPGFETFENGLGYIYSNQNATTINFVGELNVNDVARDVNEGWNLVANPFAQNVRFSDFELNEGTMTGFYKMTEASGWNTEITALDATVEASTGILIYNKDASSITVSRVENSGAKRGNDKYAYIEINVANANYSDRAYAAFTEGYGLPKYDHINGEIQKIYIPQNGENFAIATMDESVTLFPVNFKAMTTGYYTISLKSSQIYEGLNDFDYLHLIDNMTGEEIDMLLENGYKFVGSPADNANRFTVKLHRNGVEENEVEIENFVYQNGNSLVISGEGTFQLIDMLGRVVISKEVHGETVSVDNLITGAYIVRMIGNEVKTQKIVIR